MRIIGCGNRERGDDAVGLFVADRLRELGADAEAYSGDPFGLMHLWTAGDDVLLVDAVVTGACPGAVYLWDGLNHRCLSFASPVSNHGFDVTQAIQLARALGHLPTKLRICAIEAQDFAVGGEITDRVLQAGAAVVEAVLQECNASCATRNNDKFSAARVSPIGPSVSIRKDL